MSQIIPAQPGWVGCSVENDEGDYHTSCEPIIAWCFVAGRKEPMAVGVRGVVVQPHREKKACSSEDEYFEDLVCAEAKHACLEQEMWDAKAAS